VQPFIEKALRLSPEELEKTAKSDTNYSFLYALAGFTRDRQVLRDQLIAVLLAGRDTTAATLSWTFFELSRHPEVVTRLRQEVLDTIGPDRKPTYDDLKSMKYLQYVLNETLRLYPAVPFNVRFAHHDTSLPTGGGPRGDQPMAVLKGSPVGYSTLTMQRRKDIFGADVDEFRPERWEGGWSPKAWTYIPFNGGPRICIGQQFAITEMQYTLVRLLQRYDTVEPRMKPEEQFLKAEIVLQPGAGVFVGLKRAAEKSG
jgi:cytochrome P450